MPCKTIRRTPLLSSSFYPSAHKPSHQLLRRLLLPLPTAGPQRSVERRNARLGRGQCRQLLVRAAFGWCVATAGHGRRARQLMVVMMMQVVIIETDLAEPVMVLEVMVGRCSQVKGGLLLLQLSRVLNNIVLLGGLLLLRQVRGMRKKGQWGGLCLKLEQILVLMMVVGMGVVLELILG